MTAPDEVITKNACLTKAAQILQQIDTEVCVSTVTAVNEEMLSARLNIVDRWIAMAEVSTHDGG